MRRRTVLKLVVSGVAIAKLLHIASQQQTSAKVDNQQPVSTSKLSASKSITAEISVDWAKTIAQSTPFTFGSNDYEIVSPKKAADPVYQSLLAELDIGLIRVHHANLSDRWTDPKTKTWDQSKIKAGYDVSYHQHPTIIQNIPSWPKWMKQAKGGLLDPSEYDNYATFCAELVEIINNRQQRRVTYWEPFNEKDVAYHKAGKLDQLWEIYNKAATAMKAKDPQIKVGGPALTWDEPDRLAAFLKACRPNVDFISWHRYGSGNAKESTNKLMSYTPKYQEQVTKFRAVASQYIPDRKVPLLLGEYNINYSWKSGENRQNTHIGAVWFASVLKHLADAGIDMATSWHLKDGIYGMIDPKNQLRPAATVFAWGRKYLTGRVSQTESSHPLVEAMAVTQKDDQRSLLLINKSAATAIASVQLPNTASNIQMLSLDTEGIKSSIAAILNQEPLLLKPYSLVLLRFDRQSQS